MKRKESRAEKEVEGTERECQEERRSEGEGELLKGKESEGKEGLEEEETDEAWLLRKKEERKLVEGSSGSGKAKESDTHESASTALGSGVESSKQTKEEEEEESTGVNKDDMEEDDEDEEDEEEGDSSSLWAPPRQLCLAEFLPPGEFSFLPPARWHQLLI